MKDRGHSFKFSSLIHPLQTYFLTFWSNTRTHTHSVDLNMYSCASVFHGIFFGWLINTTTQVTDLWWVILFLLSVECLSTIIFGQTAPLMYFSQTYFYWDREELRQRKNSICALKAYFDKSKMHSLLPVNKITNFATSFFIYQFRCVDTAKMDFYWL